MGLNWPLKLLSQNDFFRYKSTIRSYCPPMAVGGGRSDESGGFVTRKGEKDSDD